MNCSECNTPLKDVWPGAEENDQYAYALPVHLDGGYGMFADQIGEPSHYDERSKMFKVVLCHACAHRLCDAFECISEILQKGHMDPAGSFAACPLFDA